MATENGGRRVNGWKEIAAFFDRSTRTVQRWEREFGLPVRRLGIGRGEVVYAYVDELTRWQTSAEAEAARASAARHRDDDPAVNGKAEVPDEPAPNPTPNPAVRKRWTTAALIGVGVLIALGAVAWQSSIIGGGGREPSRWHIDTDALFVAGSDGNQLWSHRFPFRILEEDHREGYERGAVRLAIADIDGDGHREVLFLTVPVTRRKSDWKFYCFEYDGRIRWIRDGQVSQRYGERTAAGPFVGHRLFLEPLLGRTSGVWLVFVHSPFFPSVLYGVDASGRTTSEFWSAGYITTIRGAAWNGRPMLLVGARNNESSGASLALLDGLNPTGAAPAGSEPYRCATCPSGPPEAFVEFPKPAPLASLGGTSSVLRIEADNPDAILVWVNHLVDVDLSAELIFTLDRYLRPIDVSVTDGLFPAWEELNRRGQLPPPPADRRLDGLGVVRWWNGSGFETLTVTSKDAKAKRSNSTGVNPPDSASTAATGSSRPPSR